MIKVLVVDDSATAREYLAHIFDSDPAITVIGCAKDGAGALELVQRLKPDVVTMDIHMPFMNGIEATRRIMESNPVPIVIVSGVWDPKEMETTFRAIEAGALAVVQRPRGAGQGESESSQRELISKVKLMSEVKVVRRWARPTEEQGAPRSGQSSLFDFASSDGRWNIGLVAVGASTGGPMALRTILAGLPRHFPVPILVVQHIATGFLAGMLEWLSEASRLRLHIGREGETALGGHVYFAPDGHDMGVKKGGILRLSKEGGATTRPSVSHLFRSVMEVYGEKSAAVLLTGMGRDGADELRLMRNMGALTIVQDEESSVVFGMPGEALKIDAARYVLPPDKIAAVLANAETLKARS